MGKRQKLNDSDKIVKIKGFRDNVSLINFMLTEKCPFRATVLKSKYVTFVLFLKSKIVFWGEFKAPECSASGSRSGPVIHCE